MTDFPKALRQARGEMTTDELGKRAGVSAPYITNIERGHRIPDPDVMLRLCKALDLDPAPFIDWCITAKMGPEAKEQYDRMRGGDASLAPPQTYAGRELPIMGAFTVNESGEHYTPAQDETVTLPPTLLTYAVMDDALLPLFEPGDKIMADPTTEPEDGGLAIVIDRDGRVYARRYWVQERGRVLLEGTKAQPPISLSRKQIAHAYRVVGILLDD